MSRTYKRFGYDVLTPSFLDYGDIKHNVSFLIEADSRYHKELVKVEDSKNPANRLCLDSLPEVSMDYFTNTPEDVNVAFTQRDDPEKPHGLELMDNRIRITFWYREEIECMTEALLFYKQRDAVLRARYEIACFDLIDYLGEDD